MNILTSTQNGRPEGVSARLGAWFAPGSGAYPIISSRPCRTITISPGAIVCREAEIVGDVTIGMYIHRISTYGAS